MAWSTIPQKCYQCILFIQLRSREADPLPLHLPGPHIRSEGLRLPRDMSLKNPSMTKCEMTLWYSVRILVRKATTLGRFKRYERPIRSDHVLVKSIQNLAQRSERQDFASPHLSRLCLSYLVPVCTYPKHFFFTRSFRNRIVRKRWQYCMRRLDGQMHGIAPHLGWLAVAPAPQSL